MLVYSYICSELCRVYLCIFICTIMSVLEIKHIYPLRFPLPTHVPNGPGETARRHLSVISLASSLELVIIVINTRAASRELPATAALHQFGIDCARPAHVHAHVARACSRQPWVGFNPAALPPAGLPDTTAHRVGIVCDPHTDAPMA